MTVDRRQFLQASVASTLGVKVTDVLAGDSGRPDAAQQPGTPDGTIASPERPIFIDTLGGIGNPNLGESDTSTESVDARGIRDALDSGLTAVNQTIGYVSGPMDPFEFSVAEVAAWDALIRAHDGALLKVLGADDIRLAHDSGRVGIILGFQNAAAIGADPKRVATFVNLGVRIIQLTYNIRNLMGDGAMVAENRGLTPLGREVVHALNENRAMVDLSHSGEQTCLDTVAASKSPVIISHTGCRALVDLPRNKSDRELRLVAEKGGLVGIYFMPFLAMDRQPTADDLIRHIEHAVQVCGEDHVCIGTDGTVAGVDDLPKYLEELRTEVAERKAAGISATGERADIVPFLPDLQGPAKFHRLAELLRNRGYRAARVDKILGGNFLRYAGEIW